MYHTLSKSQKRRKKRYTRRPTRRPIKEERTEPKLSLEEEWNILMTSIIHKIIPDFGIYASDNIQQQCLLHS